MRWCRWLGRHFKKGQRVFFAASKPAVDVTDRPDYQFAELSEADFKQSSLVQTRDRPQVFSLRLSWGHRCYGWRDRQGQIAGYLWLSDCNALNTPWMFDVNLTMHPDCVYIWDCRTAPGHENRGLYTAGLTRLRQLAADKGGGTALIDCAPDNAASIRAIEKAGFRRMSNVELWNVGPLRLLHTAVGWRAISARLDPRWLEA